MSLSQPELVSDEARVGMDLIVADARRDEVDAVLIDQWDDRCFVDELAIDLGPDAGGGARVRRVQEPCSEVFGLDSRIAEPAVVERPPAGEQRREGPGRRVAPRARDQLHSSEKAGMSVVEEGMRNEPNASAIAEAS